MRKTSYLAFKWLTALTLLAAAVFNITSVQGLLAANKSLLATMGICFLTVIVFIELLSPHLRFESSKLNGCVPGGQGPCFQVWAPSHGKEFLPGVPTGLFRKGAKLGHLPLYRLVGTEFHGFISSGDVLDRDAVLGRFQVQDTAERTRLANFVAETVAQLKADSNHESITS